MKRDEKRIFFICGVCGAGKSTALNAFEDIGFHCIDKLPAELLEDFASFALERGQGRFALLLDIEGKESFKSLDKASDRLKQGGFNVSSFYFDAQDDVLLKRFKETRRPHPRLVRDESGVDEGRSVPSSSSSDTTIAQALDAERLALKGFKTKADRVFDTSFFSPHQLRKEIESVLDFENELKVQVVSFGFKYGAPKDADLVMDVRFLPNPYFVDELREHNGTNPVVRDYVFSSGEASEFLDHFGRILQFLLPKYQTEGKRYLTVAIGCTGGKHRSVALSERCNEMVAELGFKVSVTHRDLVQLA